MTDVAAALPLGFDALLASALLQAAAWLWPARRLSQASIVLAVVACAALAVGLVDRGRSAGQWPLTSQFEFMLWLALATTGTFLALVALRHPPSIGIVLVPLAAAILGYALLVVPPAQQAVQPAPPVFRSIWLQVHVLSAALGFGAGAAAGALALAWFSLARPARSDRGLSGLLTSSDAAAAMCVSVEMAFPPLSLALLSGAVWAQAAWGSYWSWYPKEVWALVTWLVLLAFLHARASRGWRGSGLASLAVLGLACIVFALLGAGWLARATGLGDMPLL